MKKTHEVKTAVKRKKAPIRRSRRTRFAISENVHAPSQAEARRRIRSQPGFFESLGPEALEAIMNYPDPPGAIGPPSE